MIILDAWPDGGAVCDSIAYLAHPTMGPRLVECVDALLQLENRSARDVMGSRDDLKLRSSMTLFAAVSADDSLFQRVLDRYFDGCPDRRTIDYLADHE